MKKIFQYNQLINKIKDDEIEQYFKNTLEMSDKVTADQMEDLRRNPDIYNEFKYAYYNMKNHDFKEDILCFTVEDPVTVEGYTAFDLYHKFGNRQLAIGIFNLLISLREDPKKTLDYISRGLPEH